MSAKKPYAVRDVARLRAEIKRLDDLATGAGIPGPDGAWGAAVSATAKAAELRQKLAHVEAEAALGADADELDRLDLAIRGATEDRSWIAVEKLVAQRVAIVRERAAAAEAKRKAEEAAQSAGSLYDRVVAMIARMPPAQRQALRARLDTVGVGAN